MTFWTACASCLPFSCTPFDDDDQRRRRRRGAPEISAPRALRPRQSRRNTRTSWIASIVGKPSSSEQRPHDDVYENISTGVPLTTLSTEDVHLLERYQSLARAEGWRRPASRSTAASLPRTPDLEQPDEERSKLGGVQSRDYISLRSGTPSVRDQTPPPPPKKTRRTTRSPLSEQNPWAARRSIRRVGSFPEEDEERRKGLFTPLPLELDFSPLDVFGTLVVDVQSDGSAERSAEGKVELPSRPKLVHFATTPLQSRHDLEPFEPNGEDQREMRSVSRRSVTPMYRPPPSTPRPRTITPIHNAPRLPASPHTSPRKSTSSWTQGIRSSIYRDLTPVEPSPAQRRTRPDPALFPGVIPWKVSPRDVGMRRQEKEWRRLQTGEGQQEKWHSGSRSRWSSNGRPRSKDLDIWKGRSAGSEDEAEREEDGWEVLR